MFLRVLERSDAENTLFDDLEEEKKVFLWKNLHFVVCNSFTYDRIEFNFFAKDIKYIYFIEYLHFDAQQHLRGGFSFENM